MDDGRLVLGATRQAGQAAADPVLLQNLLDMGFPENQARVALESTSNRNLEVRGAQKAGIRRVIDV